jgi:hypothetical protein
MTKIVRIALELNDLIFLGACSLKSATNQYGHAKYTMEEAIKIAKGIWAEVLKQDMAEE